MQKLTFLPNPKSFIIIFANLKTTMTTIYYKPTVRNLIFFHLIYLQCKYVHFSSEGTLLSAHYMQPQLAKRRHNQTFHFCGFLSLLWNSILTKKDPNTLAAFRVHLDFEAAMESKRKISMEGTGQQLLPQPMSSCRHPHEGSPASRRQRMWGSYHWEMKYCLPYQ